MRHFNMKCIKYVEQKMRLGQKKRLFTKLIEPHYEGVYYYILSVVKDSSLAQDLTQSTMEKAWNRLGQLSNENAAHSW